ncbi:uncharacterized protein [Rutidosis leptorrhynchoides]|uniref:uncharacterized protein n=1 Tax=Rutidosis leptorrhynchoides TaxID=125765 RepID=UPI003A98E896
MGNIGFGCKRLKWVHPYFRSTTITILVNGSPTKEFSLHKGIRKGDPLFPDLFIIASEGLNVLANIAIRDWLIRGVGVGEDRVRISHLQIVDDTIFFGDWGIRNISNVHKILTGFEKVSGLMINMKKSLIYEIGGPHADVEAAATKFGCDVGKTPFTCLGMPGGGLNVGSLKARNWALLGKWWWRFRTETESLWVKVIKSIYGRDRGLGHSTSNLSIVRSTIWSNIIHIGIDLFKIGLDINSFFEKKIGDGRDVLFWKDIWTGDTSLKDKFPRLFRLDTNQDTCVNERVQLVNGLLQFSWEWARLPLGRVTGELEQLTGLIGNNVSLSDGNST